MTELPERLLYCPIPLTGNSRETDLANALALVHAKPWFTKVLIVTRAWPEVPDAIYHSIIKLALEVCRAIGMPVVWGRWLWTGWPPSNREEYMTGALSHLYPAYYAATIARLKSEADAIGAVDTMVDAEPNGKPDNEANLIAGFDTWQLRHVQAAILQAVHVAGQVGYIYPAASGKATAYPWAMVGLGKIRLVHKTYSLFNADARVVMNPPDGVKAKLDLWGHWVSENKLSPAVVKGFDMAKVRERYPENIGQWVYADKFADVLKSWGS